MIEKPLYQKRLPMTRKLDFVYHLKKKTSDLPQIIFKAVLATNSFRILSEPTLALQNRA